MIGEPNRIEARALPLSRLRAEDWCISAPVVALAAVVAIAATTGVGVASSWFDEQRILLLVALSGAAIAAKLLFPAPADMCSAAVFAALALGLVSAVVPPRPFVALADWSVYCLIALLIISVRADRLAAVEKAASLVAVIVPSAYVTGVMANYVAALLLGFPVGAETLLVGFSNPRFPAQLQVLTIPLLPFAAQKAPTRFWRACIGGVASLWWMCLIGSGSRTGWIALAVAAIVVSLIAAEGRRWLRWQLVIAVSGAALWLLLFHVLPSLLSVATTPEVGRFSDFTSVGARFKLWRLSVEAAIAHPFLGLGPMHFAYLDNGDGAHPHNFWLQLAGEWGIPAALLAGGAVVALVSKLWLRTRSEADSSSRWLGVSLLASVVAWCIGTLSDGYMVIPTSQAMSAAVLMLAVMWLRLASRSTDPRRMRRLATMGSTVFLSVALIVLAALPTTEFGHPTRREQMWRVEHRGQMMWPRFWQQGWIGPDADPSARRQPHRGGDGAR